MRLLLFAICIVAIATWLSPTLTEAQPGSESKDGNAKYESLAREVKMLQESLAVKQAELSKLRHKWTVSKGRTPTKEELIKFEENRAKGEVKIGDNPYVNKTPLSSPARSRSAYYEKLAETNKVKEKLTRLEQELAALKR
jgi:hypothetical protein